MIHPIVQAVVPRREQLVREFMRIRAELPEVSPEEARAWAEKAADLCQHEVRSVKLEVAAGLVELLADNDAVLTQVVRELERV